MMNIRTASTNSVDTDYSDTDERSDIRRKCSGSLDNLSYNSISPQNSPKTNVKSTPITSDLSMEEYYNDLFKDFKKI